MISWFADGGSSDLGDAVSRLRTPSSHSRLLLCYRNPRFQLGEFHVGAKLGQPDSDSEAGGSVIDGDRHGDDEASESACRRRPVMLLSAKRDPEKRAPVMGGVPGRCSAPCKDCVQAAWRGPPASLGGALSVTVLIKTNLRYHDESCQTLPRLP